MASDHINREATISQIFDRVWTKTDADGYVWVLRRDVIHTIDEIPAADVVPADDYKHLFQIANKMHLWIFNHTFDEQAAYDECGLTDEDNAMLGYGGSWELRADSADGAE